MKKESQTKKITKTLFLTLMIAMLVLSITGCNTITPKEDEFKQITQTEMLKQNEIKSNNFKSVQEYESFLKTYSYNNYGYAYGGMNRGGMMLDMAVPAMAIAESSFDSSTKLGSGAPDYSGTNVQVQGIDEADLLKTDGKYIYTYTNKDVFIIKATPAEDAEVISTINLKNQPTGLFINNDVLAVIGTINDYDELSDIGFSNMNQFTFLNLYDVTNPEKPILVKEYKFEGYYNDARLKEDYIYLVTNMAPVFRDNPLPIIMEGTTTRNIPIQKMMYFNIHYNNPWQVNVHSINMETGQNTDSMSVTTEGGITLYMSHQNIYLAYNQYINEWEIQEEISIQKVIPLLPSKDKEYITRLEQIDEDLMSKQEKRQKILEIAQRYIYSLPTEQQEQIQEEIELEVKKELEKIEHFQYTVINKAQIDQGKITLQGNNKVPGRLNNQFAMDEYKEYLRIATTLDGRWNSWTKIAEQRMIESTNNVYTLDKNMNIKGKLEGLAKTEMIYSTRFIQDKLYMVTFRQVDPFFVIDLSNPERPQNLGELKIPGYSRYLHPYDENTIIGIGRDATETGTLKGYKISLFDVTDVTNPKELITYTAEQSTANTAAEWEHKAFLFSKEKELLVIPMQNYDWRDSRNNMQGAMVFKINLEEITPRGLIEHTNTGYEGVQRTLYINQELYTKSPELLRINNLETLTSTKNITLTTQKTGTIPIY